MKTHILISGKVQGVFFRTQTQKKAQELGLKGWVRNTEDGKVEAVFEGEEEKVKEMVKWCGKGPSGSQVKKVEEVEKVAGEKLEDFEIRY